jgi:hypothetical protein
MRVALVTSFRASRKEPLGDVLERIHGAFATSGLDEPQIRFSFADGPLPGSVSSVDRVIKRYPAMGRWVSTAQPMPSAPPVRMITNGPTSPANGEQAELATLFAIAKGVPRSFPFHSIAIHFKSPAFGGELPIAGPMGSLEAGVLVGDSWWVNGRNRSVMAITSVDTDPAAKALPAPPANVAAVLEACGKVAETTQMPLADTPQGAAFAAAPPETMQAVSAVVVDYRKRLAEVIDRARLPHDLPSGRGATRPGGAPGPKKPALVKAFWPLGYQCRGESGLFTLRRRTSGNHTVEVYLDVGTWSNSLTGFFSVEGLGFKAQLPLPVSKRAIDARQYDIGGPERWQQIVENLAALVAELDRSFVPAVEAAAGPSPEWYQPQRGAAPAR